MAETSLEKNIPLAHPPDGSDPLEFVRALVREHGDACIYRNSYGPVYFFNHPDMAQGVMLNPNMQRYSTFSMVIGRGLLASTGDLWREQRRLIQPVFHDRCMGGYASVIIEATAAMLDRWERAGIDATPFDFAVEMRRLALEITLKALFTMEKSADTTQWDDALTTLFEDIGAISSTQFNLPLRFSTDRNARLQQARQTLNTWVFGMMKERRALAEKPRDLLALLLDAKDEETGQPLDDNLIRDEIVSMLLAGHETTSSALCWVFYAFSEHPEIEEQVAAAVRNGLRGRLPGLEDLGAFPGVRAVLEETMRLYPPVWFVIRKALREEKICGYRIPEGGVVHISPYTTHRHPEFWKDPERFDLSRFSTEEKAGRHRFAYFPFSGGRHQCAGQPLAMLEGQLIIMMILQRYRVRRIPDHPVVPRAEITMRMQHGLVVSAEKRESAMAS